MTWKEKFELILAYDQDKNSSKYKLKESIYQSCCRSPTGNCTKLQEYLAIRFWASYLKHQEEDQVGIDQEQLKDILGD